MALSKVAIGIDLGTTSSAVGVWRNGKVEIIPNDRGQRTSPSYIAFTSDGGRLIGDAAMAQVATNPKNTVWAFKALLGRSFDDPALQEWIKHWPFKVINVGGKPNVELEVNGGTKRFTPEELTCLLLLNLKYTAETYLGQRVTDAVITIPAGCNSFQVAATKKAAELAGLNVLKLISDPNAAALAYVEKTGTGGGGGGKKNLLICNVGGGSTGASVVAVEDGLLEVKATTGNKNQGGEHFVSTVVGDIRKSRSTTGLRRDDSAALQQLRMESESAIRKLSRSSSGTAAVAPIIFNASNALSNNAIAILTQAVFEKLCGNLFHDAVTQLLASLIHSKVDKSDIHEVLLVGGSSRIPKIQSLLLEYLDGKELNKSLDPDEAPAQGAAILAAIISGCRGSPPVNLTLRMDMTPFSLGVQTSGDMMNPLIGRNTPIPSAKVTRPCTTAYDNQPALIVAVFGESLLANPNTLLATFSLSEIPPAPAGVPKIELTFEVDANRKLTVNAVEESTDQEKRITIDPGNGEMLTREELTQKLINDAKAKKIQDYQKAHASVKSSYEAMSKLFCSPEEARNFMDKKMKELEREKERHESLLSSQEFPIVVGPAPASASSSSTYRTSRGGGQGRKTYRKSGMYQ